MDFFESVLPTKGLYCLASATYNRLLKNLSNVKHYKFNTLQELVEGANELIRTNDGLELYVSPSSYATCKTPNKGFRASKNCAWVKSLFIDVDIRSLPQYCQSVEEALEELNKLCASTNWPSPWVINSGGGLHLYWPLTEDTEPEAWHSMATKFLDVVATYAPKLVADSARTKDRAALLRLPASFNHKRLPPTQVQIVSEATGTLDPSILDSDLARRLEVDREIPCGEVKDKDKIHIDDVVTSCNWMRQYVENQENASEPEWYAAMSLARFIYIDHPSEKANTAGVALSLGHPGYSPSGVEKKIAQLEKQAIGPATCHRLSGMFPERCRGCPLRGMVNSPIAGARKVSKSDPLDINALFASNSGYYETEETDTTIRVGSYEILRPPAPFFFKDNGIYTTIGENIKRIFDFAVMPLSRSKDEYTGQEMVEIVAAFPKDEPRVIRMPMSLTADDRKMGTFLADYGVIPDRGMAPHFYRYIVAHIRMLQNAKAATRQYSQLGWRFPNVNDIRDCEFVLGDVVYSRGRWLQNTSISPSLIPSKPSACAAGTIEAWRNAFNILNDINDAEPLIVGALMGFAAPLIEFTPYSGVLVNLYGGSGRGKSTAQRFATSIWGVPNERMILTQDNRIPMLNRLGSMKNLPVTFDELTEMEPEALGTLLYEISGGRGKERANIQGVTKVNEATWKTIVLGSSNTSIYSKIARLRTGNNGQAYRVLEFEVSPAAPEYAVAIDAAKAILDSNYGYAGRMYAERIANEVVAIKNRLTDEIPKLMVGLKAQPAERFWVAAIAAFKVGAGIAKDMGLHDYPVDRLVHWLFRAAKEARSGVAESYGNALDAIGNFLLENISSSIRDDGKSLIVLPANVRTIGVRYYGDSKKVAEVAVAKKVLLDYCRKSRIEYAWLMSNLRSSGCLIGSRRVNLMERTGMPDIEVDCFMLDMKSLGDMNFHVIEAAHASTANKTSPYIN